MPLSAAAVAEASAQETGTAWLALLVLDHADLPAPIRVTSDAVATISGGQTYSPFPFQVTLPDDTEGRAPQAQITIDNTSKEIIAALRALTSPPTLTIRVVRASAPDVVEREWVGLEWSSSQYDIATITGTLTVDDLAREEFPPITFDATRFPGLFS